MNVYEQRVMRRKAALQHRADRLDREAAAAFAKADPREEASGIPFGQPILVGHHSEGKHRRAIARQHAAMDKGVAAAKAAEEARYMAAGVGHAGISADDPEAVPKLEAKVAALKAAHAAMVAANKEARAAGQPAPHPAYRLSNSNANLKRYAVRLKGLAWKAEQPVAAPVEREDGVRIVEDAEANRLQVFFPGKPEEAVRAALKSAGFRWAPSVGAWQRQLNNAARYALKRALED